MRIDTGRRNKTNVIKVTKVSSQVTDKSFFWKTRNYLPAYNTLHSVFEKIFHHYENIFSRKRRDLHPCRSRTFIQTLGTLHGHWGHRVTLPVSMCMSLVEKLGFCLTCEFLQNRPCFWFWTPPHVFSAFIPCPTFVEVRRVPRTNVIATDLCRRPAPLSTAAQRPTRQLQFVCLSYLTRVACLGSKLPANVTQTKDESTSHWRPTKRDGTLWCGLFQINSLCQPSEIFR